MELARREVPIARETDIAMARLAAGELAEDVGLDTTEKHSVVTSVSELAWNILLHAGSGTVVVHIVVREDGDRGVEIVASDRGRGIADIDLALRDGFSTGGGLGGGLPGVKRLMSEIAISSSAGEGTVVRAVKWRAGLGSSVSGRGGVAVGCESIGTRERRSASGRRDTRRTG